MTLDEFATMTPQARQQYVASPFGDEWLQGLTPEDLDEAGRLLCQATPANKRDKAPIIGDYPTETRVVQERFEERLFGYEQELSEDMQ